MSDHKIVHGSFSPKSQNQKQLNVYQYENGLLKLWYNHTMEYWSAIKKVCHWFISHGYISWVLYWAKEARHKNFRISLHTTNGEKNQKVCLSVVAVNWLAEDMKELFDRDVDSKDVSKMYLFVKTIQFTIGPLAMPLLGIHPEKNMIWKDTGIPMFIAVVFT